MYGFAILALGALLAAKTVDLVGHAWGKDLQKAVKVLGAMAFGVVYAYLFDYSIYAAWGIDVREGLALVATGLFMGALAGVWHEVLGLMREWAHRYHGEASEIEARIHRAA